MDLSAAEASNAFKVVSTQTHNIRTRSRLQAFLLKLKVWCFAFVALCLFA